MSDSSNNLIPSRQMSGRRSKPSIELLVDNQRLLTEYVGPTKVSRNYIKKPFTVSMSNHREKSPLSVRVKPGPKCRQLSSITKAEGENMSPKVIDQKPKISLALFNGSKEKVDTVDAHVESQLMKEDDDLPLSKVFPDFKPRPSDPEAVRRLSLPPKKKIKFVDINELLGLVPKLSPVSPDATIPDEKPRPRTDVLSLPKIPRKSRENGTGESLGRVGQKSPDRGPTVSRTEATTRRCVRRTCTNVAIDDCRWDWEFCSADCAVVHSKYVLNEWLFQRREPPSLLI